MNVKLIRDENDYNSALRRIDELWDSKPNTIQGDELEVLSMLVENYENTVVKIETPDPIEAIKFRMEQVGLNKTDLAVYLGGRNRATEILNRKRGLSVRMMRTLHSKLQIPAESLLSEPLTLKRNNKLKPGNINTLKSSVRVKNKFRPTKMT